MNLEKNVFVLTVTLILLFSLSLRLFADETSSPKPKNNSLGGLSLTPTIGALILSGSEQRDVTQAYGLKLGYEKIGRPIVESLGIEGTLNYFSTTSKTDGKNTSGYLFRLD